MTTQTYDVGDKRRLAISFTDFADAPADPTTISAIITEPDGIVVTFVFGTDAELVKDSVGNYHVDYTFTKPGRHHVRFEGTGSVTSAEQADVYIRAKL